MFVGAYNDDEQVMVGADLGIGEDDDAFSAERLKARLKDFVLNYRTTTAIYRDQLRQH